MIIEWTVLLWWSLNEQFFSYIFIMIRFHRPILVTKRLETPDKSQEK